MALAAMWVLTTVREISKKQQEQGSRASLGFWDRVLGWLPSPAAATRPSLAADSSQFYYGVDAMAIVRTSQDASRILVAGTNGLAEESDG